MINNTPPISNMAPVAATLFRAAVNTEGVIFSNIHVFNTISNTIANTRSRMKPIETLAKASLGESI